MNFSTFVIFISSALHRSHLGSYPLPGPQQKLPPVHTIAYTS